MLIVITLGYYVLSSKEVQYESYFTETQIEG